MIESISQEISMQKSFLGNEPLETIYFGGGTPSILEPREIGRILNVINQYFSISNDSEITLESNPDDLSIQKLDAIKSLGINRLSIGIQSFHDKLLTFLHRAHKAQEAIWCVENARKAGFTNISIDLIFSIPGQSRNDLNKDINQAIALIPEHISIYGLTIEDKTVFGTWKKKGKFKPISEEKSEKQYDLILSMLEENGYEQYEISNFCLDDNYARHNTGYWKNINYLGIGPGAHSYNGKNRQFNIRNNHLYMKSISAGAIPFEIDELDEKAHANEFLLTSLRTKWGCDMHRLTEEFGYDILTLKGKEIKKLVEMEFIIICKNTISLTRKGKFLADEVISELFWL